MHDFFVVVIGRFVAMEFRVHTEVVEVSVVRGIADSLLIQFSPALKAVALVLSIFQSFYLASDVFHLFSFLVIQGRQPNFCTFAPGNCSVFK